jgi:UDP-glucuronate 4-epimerase
MKILITGIAGFIGFHLSQELSKAGHVIYGIDNFSSLSKKTQKLRKKYLKKKIELKVKKIDIKNFNLLLNAYKKIKIDMVIHLAAQPGVRVSQSQPLITIDENLKNFINVLEFCKIKKIKNLFYASSSSVYGKNKHFRENLTLKNTTSIYAASKLCNEIIASTYNYLYGINTLALRFFTVYGPFGREDMVYYKFLDQITKFNKITIFGNSNSVRSFTYIDDVTKAILKLIKKFKNKKSYNEILNIGNINIYSLNDLIQIIKKRFNSEFKIIFLKRNKSDMLKTIASVKKLKKFINFYPKINLDTGMKFFIDWYKRFA